VYRSGTPLSETPLKAWQGHIRRQRIVEVPKSVRRKVNGRHEIPELLHFLWRQLAVGA
jgi:hypothetical protein